MDVSFQLYSARNHTPWDDVIRDIAKLGYNKVEGFPGVYEDPKGFRRLLDTYGVTMPSGHFSLEMLEDGLPDALDIAATLGMSRIYCPMLAPTRRPSDRSGWQAFAAHLQAIRSGMCEAGFDFGWHNHDFEFQPGADGTIPMQAILEGAPGIGWEADIAWIVRGGSDPVDWIANYGDRITAVHVKDLAPSGENEEEDGWADVGHGTMNWNALTASLRSAGCSLYVVEHDKPSDARRFAERSITAFRSY